MSLIVHATENFDKLIQSISKVFDITLNKKNVERRDVSGHHGNPIVYVSISLKDLDAQKVFTKIFNSLSNYEKLLLYKELNEYYVKSTFYIRLNKQDLCLGNISLSEADAIRIIFKNISKETLGKYLEV